MNDQQTISKTLDARGLYCPMPIVKIDKVTREMKSGEIVKVLCTDPGSKRDFESWCEKTANKLLKTSEEDDVFVYIIEETA